MSALTFRGWLALQADRRDPVGALARVHARCRFTDYPAFTRHLVAEHPTGAELAACRTAGKAYARYSRLHKLPAGSTSASASVSPLDRPGPQPPTSKGDTRAPR